MLNPALIRLAWRESLRRAGYTALMVVGVALGVAVVVAIDLANESARRGFALSTGPTMITVETINNSTILVTLAF